MLTRLAPSLLLASCSVIAATGSLTAQAAPAASQKPVSIVCLCADRVGQAYEASLQDTLKRTPTFSLARAGSSGSAPAVHIRIASHTTAATPQKRAGTVILVEATYGDTRIVQQMEVCERLSVDGLADKLLHSLKEVVAEEDAAGPAQDTQAGQS